MIPKKIYYLTFAEDPDWAVKEGINQDLLIVALESLRSHSDAEIVLLLQTPVSKVTNYTLYTLGVKCFTAYSTQWAGRRMLCRLEQFAEVMRYEPEGTLLISGEADEIFLDDPFQFFNQQNFDVGLAERNSGNKKPVNSGLVFFRKSPRVVTFYDWAVEQIKKPTWATYHKHRHRKNTHDVYCDIDLWLSVWRGKTFLQSRFGIQIELVDCGYLMNEALRNGKCSFHLKGNTKRCIYEKGFTERISNG